MKKKSRKFEKELQKFFFTASGQKSANDPVSMPLLAFVDFGLFHLSQIAIEDIQDTPNI